jgi:hypothetical protein
MLGLQCVREKYISYASCLAMCGGAATMLVPRAIGVAIRVD